ncbi:MAG: hypothetical protein OXI63_04070, partial [Candidatus Poribacteria bacterium]|nr:hypothetical protein [Candidatus Poribacteria bacterium]
MAATATTRAIQDFMSAQNSPRPSSFPRTHAIPCSSDESLFSTDDILSSILFSIDDILSSILFSIDDILSSIDDIL